MTCYYLKNTRNSQQARVSIGSSGTYNWIYPIPYSSGVIPNIQITPENNTSNNPFFHKVTYANNTGCGIEIIKSSTVNVLGIDVLSSTIPTSGIVHIRATIE